MRYRRFGKTNLYLSVFSLGTMRYLASAENAVETVRAAVDAGVNHLETARGYGNSERYLGMALQSGLERDRLYITTKITPTADGATTERYIDESLERLGIDYLDGLALHGINTPEHLERAIAPGGDIQGLDRALDDGRVRHLGFSTHGAIELILNAIETDLFEFVNLHYYYFYQRNAAAVKLAAEKDMGIFIISPADKGGRLYTPSEKLKKLSYPFSPLELNYRFLLSKPYITTLSVGAATPDELIEPLKVADNDGELNLEEIAVFEKLENHQNTVLAVEKCSQCYECLPCPENINIPEVLRLRNLTVAYDMTDYGKYRYSMFENAGHWFPGMKGNRCTECGECLPKCPEKLDIPALLKDTHERLKGKEGRRLWE